MFIIRSYLIDTLRLYVVVLNELTNPQGAPGRDITTLVHYFLN